MSVNPLSVPCPTCGSLADVPCKGASSYFNAHKARIKAAEAAKKEQK